MSVLHQQRIHVAMTPVYDDPWSEPVAASWVTYCPCCATGVELPSWAEALAWALTHIEIDHCRYCIDRQMPAGREDVLGELFERCPDCGPPCQNCDGIAVYPANYDTPTELVEDLATVRLAPVFCDGCHGVVALIPLDPEVYA